MGVKETPPRELFLPAELEEHVRKRALEFLARAVESAAKRDFAVEYKAVPAQKAPDCYDCEYCNRLRYLKGEWHCRITKPHEVPNPLACFVRRGAVPIRPTTAEETTENAVDKHNFCRFREYRGEIRRWWCTWKYGPCDRFTACEKQPKE